MKLEHHHHAQVVPKSGRKLFAMVALFAAVSAVVSLSSCTGYTGAATSASANSNADPTGSRVLSAGSASVSFGSAVTGSTTTQSVTITNTGTTTVHISQAAVSGTGFTVVGGSVASSLSAGQSATYQLQFAPTTVGALTGTLAIVSDATNSPLSVPLTGTGTQAALTVSPSSLNFNNVQVGQSGTQTVTLMNGGTANLVVTAATVSGAGFGTSGLALPKTIAAGQSATLTVQFTPTSTIGASGAIVFADNASGSQQTLTMTASAVSASSTVSANPGSFNFANVVVGSTDTQTITLTNRGTAAVTINQVSSTGAGFSATGLTVGQTIAAGATASFTAQFAPTSAGTASGAITITTTAADPTTSIAVSGTGIQAALTASPSSVAFANLAVGGSESVSMTLTNSGTAPLSITTGSVTGTGFSITGLTPQNLSPGQTTSFTTTFAPTSAGSVSGSISIASNVSTKTIALSGTGTQAQISATPAAAAFGSVVVGNSNSQTITLKNTGNATLAFSQVSVGGAGFSVAGLSTATTIAAGGSANFNVVFSPTSASAVTGSVALTTNASTSLFTISLSGTGAAATATLVSNPGSLGFGSVTVNGTNSLTATVTNNGNSNVNISGVTVTGAGFSASGVSNGTVLTPNQSVTVTVTFAPTTAGAVTGASVSIASNATGSPTNIPLSGTGQAATPHSVNLSWSPSSTPGVTGYNVFRANSSGAYGSTPLNSSPVGGTAYTDSTVVSGHTYYYVTTAIDGSNSSVDSNEMPVAIP